MTRFRVKLKEHRHEIFVSETYLSAHEITQPIDFLNYSFRPVIVFCPPVYRISAALSVPVYARPYPPPPSSPLPMFYIKTLRYLGHSSAQIRPSLVHLKHFCKKVFSISLYRGSLTEQNFRLNKTDWTESNCTVSHKKLKKDFFSPHFFLMNCSSRKNARIVFSRYLEVLQTFSKKLLYMKRRHFRKQFRICAQRKLSIREIFGNNRNKKDTHYLSLKYSVFPRNSRIFTLVLTFLSNILLPFTKYRKLG